MVHETVTIINKSGKIVKHGKLFVNIFKDAKSAYSEKKAELKEEILSRRESNQWARRVDNGQDDTQSVGSSRRSHRSHRSRATNQETESAVSRPPLTHRNLSQYTAGTSVAGSSRSKRSRSRRGTRSVSGETAPSLDNPPDQRSAYTVGEGPTQGIARRNTGGPPVGADPAYPTLRPNEVGRPRRISSVPEFGQNIDMNLAYGELPPDLQRDATIQDPTEDQLANTMSKLDTLLLEAECLQHSATHIIGQLQANPEAMAAVGLALAEISALVTKLTPSLLASMKAASPAVFALLASPQFLIAGGVALGVTVVMFGGYKIIKRMQAGPAPVAMAMPAQQGSGTMVDEALVYEGDLGSIHEWRRGIADEEARSVATSADGEFITPEAARQKKERIAVAIRKRAQEERIVEGSEGSVASGRTIRQGDVPKRGSSRIVQSESGRTEKSSKTAKTSKTSKTEKSSQSKLVKAREAQSQEVVIKMKDKKSSALSSIFRRSDKLVKEEKKSKDEARTHRPRILEL